MVPGMIHVSLFLKSCLSVISGELWLSGSSLSLSNIGVPYSDSHALVYKSSCLMVTSGQVSILVTLFVRRLSVF